MFGDLPLIADTNVWSKVRRAPPNLRIAFGDALRDGQILGSPVIRLEWLHDAREVEEFKRRDRLFSVGLRELALRGCFRRGRGARGELSAQDDITLGVEVADGDGVRGPRRGLGGG